MDEVSERDLHRYEPPRALRVGDGRVGRGQCEAPGSGNVATCENGIGASGDCILPGSGFVGVPT
jgi:hypothetical protein